jgi:hypothetical protein
MKDLISIGIIALLTVLGGTVPPVAAQGLVPARHTSLEFHVTTTIEPRCGWGANGAPAASVDLGALDIAGSALIPFEVDCNTPFVFSAVSQKRGLVRDALMADLPASFVQEMDYRVNLRMGVRQTDGSAAVVSETCTSKALGQNGMCAFGEANTLVSDLTGDSVATSADTSLSRSRPRVSWDGPIMGDPTRVAGTYSDVLTVSVSAKP